MFTGTEQYYKRGFKQVQTVVQYSITTFVFGYIPVERAARTTCPKVR